MGTLKKAITEVKIFLLCSLSIFILGICLIYGNAFLVVFDGWIYKQDILHTNSIAGVQKYIHTVAPTQEFISPQVDFSDLLSDHAKKIQFSFNTLPPGHWVILESMGIKAPIIDVPYADHSKLQKGDFDKELTQGVVKYPYTPNPGQKGNSVVFGHSSVTFWDKNKYGNVFQKLSTVPVGEDITILWNSQLYTYTIDNKVIKQPKDVAKEISSRQDKEYLTLMACYPLFSDAQRILVRGTLVPKKKSLLSATQSKILN